MVDLAARLLAARPFNGGMVAAPGARRCRLSLAERPDRASLTTLASECLLAASVEFMTQRKETIQ